MSQNNTISSMNPERAYNNVTLKNLTAFQLLSQRENICELLNLVESTERHNSIINPERQRMSLEEMKKMLDALKNERKK
ncbi:AQG_2a_G0005990.mRNA.1.CDS.1 [Saccharomyces cerevisiae]|jgi:chromatin structure-remodeling complex protein HTL1|uniref:High temperature lethal protein 1 n=7 Tax=Saccharomyces cerevisiae TaxID=4932 RepID=HTL1_YEAST|nr:Htl1p [Saccharomyces cerevisiae S288C]Q9URQ5.1 RecName: Full=High temperature lethal protein 1; AltName: Full=Chromatin structure-remodeling complex protein HTL1 [Saccharomyces cerevisiae S288C]6K15_E Chain E, High temperature lethal protein 1 [Saccharomyces cerevisiae S288C]6KW3_E Chain E, High temperature lethal protein 1 [Saccharomyces cerevisiae S288C]6KW4_E Chain E, High temperature lethal protein 1 [Saccharomyces cerevisiae S288C]6KW5_E Chain E, High temperature lethal protein 1 [Sacc|eukprot:NP_009949.1 Htl1p [Saccharomyces cerevisiae S288C]